MSFHRSSCSHVSILLIDVELKALLDEDPCQIEKVLATASNVTVTINIKTEYSWFEGYAFGRSKSVMHNEPVESGQSITGFWLLPKTTSINLNKINLRLYHGDVMNYRKFRLDSANDIVNDDYFNSNKKTFILVHGWLESPDFPEIKAICQSFLIRGDHNVMTLNWHASSFNDFLTSSADTQIIGNALAHTLIDMSKLGANISTVHLCGFSLGTQLVGAVGRNVQIIDKMKILSRITGLDPAITILTPNIPPLSSTDALFVDAIHTDMGVLGTTKNTGTADFYPNGGQFQPRCLPFYSLCNHLSAPHYYNESVLAPSSFLATNRKDPSKQANMGFGCSTDAKGEFDLTTNPTYPFSKI